MQLADTIAHCVMYQFLFVGLVLSGLNLTKKFVVAGEAVILSLKVLQQIPSYFPFDDNTGTLPKFQLLSIIFLRDLGSTRETRFSLCIT